MPNSWKRPENVPFPTIWSHFEGKKEIDGRIPKFWVQDIPEDMFDIAVEMMCKSYIFDEPLCKYSNLSNDEESVKEFRGLWRELLEQKFGLICFMENSDPNGKPIIAGLNMTCASVKGEPVPTFNGKKWAKIFSSVIFFCEIKDPYETLGITEYMNAMGLSVLPEFRGQGIGEELLKARTPLCKAVGLKATLTVFSATASQKLAVRVGFKDILNMPYDEFEKLYPKFNFPGIKDHTPNIRFMYKFV